MKSNVEEAIENTAGYQPENVERPKRFENGKPSPFSNPDKRAGKHKKDDPAEQDAKG